jgi:23S rRNA (uracil1939-C5)-methyltransferase
MLKRNMARARVKKFVKYGESRVKPRCPHFGGNVSADGSVDGKFDAKKNCGGCSWQMIGYEKQLLVKFAEVRDSLIRLGGIDTAEVDRVMRPTLGMTEVGAGITGVAAGNFPDGPWNYRNKMDFSFTTNPAGELCLGLHMKGRFHDVTEIDECHLFRPWVGEFLKNMRPFFEGLKLTEGTMLNSLIVRAGTNTGEVMVNLLVENGETDFAEKFAKEVGKFFTEESGFFGQKEADRLVSIFLTHIINKKGQPKQFLETLLWGKESFTEKLRVDCTRELSFEVAPQAFLQPNTKQSEVFYSLVRKLAGVGGKKRIFDLFCGTGTIGIVLADLAEKIVGIELNAPAVENAKANATLNGVKNIEFRIGDVNKILPELAGEVDLIVVDPPRAGLSEKIIESIASSGCTEVIYVSCNPASLARDLKSLIAKGYKLNLVQPVDQFCQTYHVETVVKLVE